MQMELAYKPNIYKTIERWQLAHVSNMSFDK